jgi:hypothetical protein
MITEEQRYAIRFRLSYWHKGKEEMQHEFLYDPFAPTEVVDMVTHTLTKADREVRTPCLWIHADDSSVASLVLPIATGNVWFTNELLLLSHIMRNSREYIGMEHENIIAYQYEVTQLQAGSKPDKSKRITEARREIRYRKGSLARLLTVLAFATHKLLDMKGD